MPSVAFATGEVSMSAPIVPGSFVLHSKLPELGNGEVLSVEKGAMRVRFASGERAFDTEVASKHLVVTIEGPAPKPPSKAKGKRKAAAKPVNKGIGKAFSKPSVRAAD